MSSISLREERTESVFEGSCEALLKRWAGGVLSLGGVGFLIVGIVMNGVRWELHPALAIFLLFCSLFLLFLLEGTQIAVVRLKEGDHIPPMVFTQAPEVAKLLTEMGEFGVANYLIGRQVLVCANVYLVAGLTELGDPLVHRLITMFAGIFTVVCFGQLIPQLMADESPILFCRIPGVKAVILLSAFISKCGIGHFSYWIGVNCLDFIEARSKKVEDMPTGESEKGSTIQLVNDTLKGGDSRQRMETLSEEIFTALKVPIDLDVRTEDHVMPHLMLAISHGLLYSDTADKAEALLKEVLSTVKDKKKKDFLTTFLRRKQAAV